MSKFKVGDKVFASSKLAKEGPRGMYSISDMSCWNITLTIKRACSMQFNTVQAYEVEENEYRYPEYALVSAEPSREFIVIRRSGAETIAELRHDREVIKSAKATCNASDTFDLETGAKIAFDRLIGREADEAMPRCKISERAPQPAHRFKVGDRVSELKAGYGIGEVVEVNTDNKTVPYRVKFDGGIIVWLNESRLSPAPEPPKYYTGKVKLVKSCGCYECEHIVGEEFAISNGYVISDRGAWGQPFSSFSDFVAKRHNKNWIEVKSDV